MAGARETTSGKQRESLGKRHTSNNCETDRSSLMLTVHIQLLGSKIWGIFVSMLIVYQFFLPGVPPFPNQTEITYQISDL